MKKYVKIFVAGVLFFSISACSSGSKNPENSSDLEQNIEMEVSTIDFKTAENYFVKNTVEEVVPAKITTQEEFDKYFEMATTMGDQGKPTLIDFNKEFVIIVDHNSTKKKVEISPIGLNKNENNLTFAYKVTENGDNGFTTHPFLMIIVDKINEGDVILKKQ
ncbi:hypothetical protein CMU25_17345 [Elizabethkingia anophelis]|nr:hypothetical protein [Elizabethkingia anophelis]MDV3842088.1 hypothetical protein [Elizabethkingia anophelis]